MIIYECTSSGYSALYLHMMELFDIKTYAQKYSALGNKCNKNKSNDE